MAPCKHAWAIGINGLGPIENSNYSKEISRAIHLLKV